MKAILRPIKRDKWSGLIKYRNCYEDLAPYFTRSGMIYTGLTQSDEERLGRLLGLDLKKGSEFWKTFFIRTYTGDLILELEDPNDELKYLFLKNHKRVKTSEFEHKASANFLLINKEEEAKKSNLINKIRRKAMKEFDTLTAEDIRKVLRLFGFNGDNMEPEVAESKLFELVENNPQSFLDKWVDNKHRETEVIIEKAVSMNIIRRTKNIYKYGSEIIGRSMIEVVDFLESPKNQDILMTIMKAIQSKVYIENVSDFKEIEKEITTEITAEPFKDITIDLDEEDIKFQKRPKRKGDTL